MDHWKDKGIRPDMSLADYRKEVRNVEKKKVTDLSNPFDGYVYWSNMYDDLMDMVTEFLGECEHSGEEPRAGEISKDTVDDMKAWNEKRKRLLVETFIAYWKEGA